jgi:hypothetical protein
MQNLTFIKDLEPSPSTLCTERELANMQYYPVFASDIIMALKFYNFYSARETCPVISIATEASPICKQIRVLWANGEYAARPLSQHFLVQAIGLASSFSQQIPLRSGRASAWNPAEFSVTYETVVTEIAANLVQDLRKLVTDKPKPLGSSFPFQLVFTINTKTTKACEMDYSRCEVLLARDAFYNVVPSEALRSTPGYLGNVIHTPQGYYVRFDASAFQFRSALDMESKDFRYPPSKIVSAVALKQHIIKTGHYNIEASSLIHPPALQCVNCSFPNKEAWLLDLQRARPDNAQLQVVADLLDEAIRKGQAIIDPDEAMKTK